MKIKWGWDDGYVSRRPDVTLEIPDEDIEGMSDSERADYIDQCVQEEFVQRVTTYWRIEGDK